VTMNGWRLGQMLGPKQTNRTVQRRGHSEPNEL